VLECPICRQPYDGSVQIFVPPHPQTFDSVACAKRAAEVWGWDRDARAPIIEVVDARAQAHAASATPRQGPPAREARRLAPARRAAFASGVCLFVAGTAASIYLWAARSPDETRRAFPVAATLAAPQLVPSRPPVVARRPAVYTPRIRPATKAVLRAKQTKRTLHPVRPIIAGVSYQARSFPLPLRIKPPDGTWAGAQWTTANAHGQPAFGWASLGRLPVDNPRGLIAIETAFGPTPSVGAIVARLRSAGGEAIYGPTTRVSLAGYSGSQVDGTVIGRFGHAFVPFSPESRGAIPADSYRLDRGEKFRIIVLDVRGTRVVLFVESFKLPQREFPSFLSAANQILGSLEFPG
jgi:hypothetical protein